LAILDVVEHVGEFAEDAFALHELHQLRILPTAEARRNGCSCEASG
jgi:hypothetical protein